ncbi:MAG TPA: CBS domain-containing protein [Chloroflexota bacterium]|nr:CBS domain-containing protein [Chloroflexota bacterium]
MKVREIMTTPVITAPADMPVGDLAELLAKRRITAVPIVDSDGAVIGLVSEYDLMARPGKTAADVMTRGVITVDQETEVDDVRFLLVERRIRRVPVMNGREMVGIISRSDIVRLMALHWICEACGESARGDAPPAQCPRCAAAGERFVQEPLHPGM